MKNFSIGQKGIAPVFLILLVVVGLGIGGLWIYQSKQTNSKDQPTATESPRASILSSPTATPNEQISPTPSPTSKGTTAPTQKPSPTPSPTPIPKPEISATFTKDGVEYRIFASWKNVSNPTGGDWLGVFPFGEKTDSPIDGKIYTQSCADKGQTDISKPGLETGSCPMYTKLDSGTYEVRLYSNDSNQRLATSGQYQVP